MSLRALLVRVLDLPRRRQVERELDDEILAHLEQAEQDHLRAGLSLEDARRAARRSFGGVDQTKEAHRDVQGFRVLAEIARDARFGLRSMMKRPGVAAAAIVTLALAIGANTAIFSAVYATLLAPLPYPDSDRLATVWSHNPKQNTRHAVVAADFLEWERQSTVFQDLHALAGRSVSLGAGRRAEQLFASTATPGFITMLGYPILIGRDFLTAAGEVGNDHVLILAYRIWQSQFGGDGDIVGQEVRVDGTPHTVVGVLAPVPAGRQVPSGDVYLPLAFTSEAINQDRHRLRVIGRLKPGVTLEQANVDMQNVAQRIAEVRPASNTRRSAVVEPLGKVLTSNDTQMALWLMLGAVGFVLLIACANVANLVLARGMARLREVAVRVALGASGGRVFAQLLTESLVLAIAGGALGVLVAWIVLDAIVAVMPSFMLPAEVEVALNVPVLLFTFGVSLLAGVLFGCVPAWQVTRATLNDTLKEAGRAALRTSRQRLRRAFVVAECALALTLLAAGGLAIRSVATLTSAELGFRTDHLLTFGLPVPPTRLTEPEQITTFYQQLVEKVEAVPGVVSVSASTGMPVWGFMFARPFSIAGHAVSDPSQRPSARFNSVTPEYYRTFGITMVRGRAFTEQDTAGRVPVAIVNETFVRRYLPNVDPLTQRVVVEQAIPGAQVRGPDISWQIVGIYRDIRNRGPRRGAAPEIDVPFAQNPWPTTTIAVRTAADPRRAQQRIAAIVQSMDPDLPMTDVRTMDQVVHEELAGDRFQALLFGSFAGIALLLAAMGIYGVLSFTVAERTHEIGLRMALGATRGQVLGQILREGLRTVLVGMVVGTVGAYLVGRAMQGLWFDVGAIDPVAFSIVVGLLLLSAALACLVPARRAASVDPLTALHDE
jgi:putative ABC transport system permease protein